MSVMSVLNGFDPQENLAEKMFFKLSIIVNTRGLLRSLRVTKIGVVRGFAPYSTVEITALFRPPSWISGAPSGWGVNEGREERGR